jgi:hypothetical protein
MSVLIRRLLLCNIAAALVLCLLVADGSSGTLRPVQTGRDALAYDSGDSAAQTTCSIPVFNEQIETENFILKWTTTSRHSPDNIYDRAIIEETAEYFETAWNKFVTAFGRKPHLGNNKKKMEVVFRDLDCYGVADPPGGPIRLDSESWVSQPGIRKPTSAHELFHKLQYAYGYRTKWKPRSPYKWFSEGTAAWAEVFVWQRVSGSRKISDLFKNPSMDLYEAEAGSLPFWIFFQEKCKMGPDHNPIVELFEEYQATGDERKALERIISRKHGSMEDFYLLFARERRTGQWWANGSNSAAFPIVLDPKGNSIIPKLNVTQVVLRKGGNYEHSGSVSKLGSGYYRFKFAPNTEGHTVTVTISSNTDTGCATFLGWEKNGVWNKDVFPSCKTGGYSYSEKIDRDSADSLMLILSGAGNKGKYKVKISIS